MILSETPLAYTSKPTVRINLSDANLSKTKLRNTVLKGAKLQRANLRNADLYRADLRKADLREADLTGAKLNRTNLTLASLNRAILEHAHVWETLFARVDLSKVQGLDKCIQPGPSVIDERTFRESGQLPLKFLQDCGLSDWQIEASKLNQRGLSRSQITDICYEVIRLRSDPALQFFSCFISYSHKDKTFARRLHKELQNQGVRCWLDEYQLLPGDDIYEEVDRGIRLWDKVLLCCSESSLKSWWVDNEIMAAFDKEKALIRERTQKTQVLIPLNLDNFMFSEEWRRGYKSQIQSRLAADFIGWRKNRRKFAEQVEKVILSLRLDEEARESPPLSFL